MSKVTDPKKLEAKIQKFFETTAASPKRLKAIQQFLEVAPDNDARKFFDVNYEQAYEVIKENFLAFEQSVIKNGKAPSKSAVQEGLVEVLEVLKAMLHYMPALLKRRWQTASIVNMVERSIVQENRWNVRVLGLEMLLPFMEGLVDLNDTPCEAMFKNIIPLHPFVTMPYQVEGKVVLQQATLVSNETILASGPQPDTIESSLQLLQVVLDFMGLQEDTFEFWWNLFKRHYLTVLYPDVCIQIGLITAAEATGFRPDCPHPIQQAMIEQIHKWLRVKGIVEVLFSTQDNATLLLGIFRQSFALPSSFIKTIQMSIGLYRDWFHDRKLPSFIQSNPQPFYRDFIEHLTIVFQLRPSTKVPQQAELMLDAIMTYRVVAMQQQRQLETPTWEFFLTTLLNTSVALLNRAEANPSMAQTTLAEMMAPILVETILVAWIRSGLQTDEIWGLLMEQSPLLTSYPETVQHWKRLVIILTMHVGKQFFKIDLEKMAKEGGLTPLQAMMLEYEAITTLPMQQRIKQGGLTDSIAANFSDTSAFVWEDLDRLDATWRRVLGVLGNVNSISDPKIHCSAMGTVAIIADMLLAVDENIGIPQKGVHIGVAPIGATPDLFFFSPWLYQACALENTFARGRAIAYGSLLRLVCRRQFQPLPQSYLDNAYRLIHMGVQSTDSSVHREILRYGNNIFALALPGADILALDFIKFIQTVMHSSYNPPLPVDLRVPSVQLLGQLICYPRHFPTATFPEMSELKVQTNGEIWTASESSVVNFDAVKLNNQLASCLFAVAREEPHPLPLIACLWTIHVLIAEELSKDPDERIVGEGLKTVISMLLHGDQQVARAACDVLAGIATLHDAMAAMDRKNISRIVKALCNNIATQVIDNRQRKEPRDKLCESLLYCLLDWLMASKPDFLGEEKTSKDVFPTLELCLQPKEYLKKEDTRGGVDSDDVVGCAAQAVLYHILTNVNHVPAQESDIAQITSDVIEKDDSDIKDYEQELDKLPAQFFVYDEWMLVSVVETNVNGQRRVRIITRDLTGKYSWTGEVRYSKETDATDLAYPRGIMPNEVEVDNAEVMQKLVEAKRAGMKPFVRAKGTPPWFNDQVNTEGTDVFGHLLEYLTESLPPLAAAADVASKLDGIDKEQRTRVDQMSRALQQQNWNEEEHLLQHNDGIWEPCTAVTAPFPEKVNEYTHCRAFLSHMGFISEATRPRFRPLGKTVKMMRALNDLDRLTSREMLKIGMIYVKPHQEEQRSVLKNEGKKGELNEQYEDFLRSLGWSVDLATHPGFMGGLDKKLTTGTQAPYYATSQMEVIFHVVTMMPTSEKDPQQIHKKRHVGNDIVHIVWSEHRRDYKPDMIKSQFNDAHIMIYPLPNGLFRVAVARKEIAPAFGPVQNNMLLTRQQLAPLVRLTAINANRYRRYATEGYKRPYPTRSKLIREIIQRYEVHENPESVIANLCHPTRAAGAKSTPSINIDAMGSIRGSGIDFSKLTGEGMGNSPSTGRNRPLSVMQPDTRKSTTDKDPEPSPREQRSASEIPGRPTTPSTPNNPPAKAAAGEEKNSRNTTPTANNAGGSSSGSTANNKDDSNNNNNKPAATTSAPATPAKTSPASNPAASPAPAGDSNPPVPDRPAARTAANGNTPLAQGGRARPISMMYTQDADLFGDDEPPPMPSRTSASAAKPAPATPAAKPAPEPTPAPKAADPAPAPAAKPAPTPAPAPAAATPAPQPAATTTTSSPPAATTTTATPAAGAGAAAAPAESPAAAGASTPTAAAAAPATTAPPANETPAQRQKREKDEAKAEKERKERIKEEEKRREKARKEEEKAREKKAKEEEKERQKREKEAKKAAK